ncbi:hypothetical protein ACFOHT_04120 [Massilia oculi]|uniref:hypothetical protein n=1 Tax=Massilia oculi TaxID=945844 RepID=UPI0013B3BAE6|nr:hypothetical protein [Massilia oculi]
MKKNRSVPHHSLYIPPNHFNASISKYYSSLPIDALFCEDCYEGHRKINTDWGTFLVLLSVNNGVDTDDIFPHGYCAWPEITSRKRTNKSSLLVIDFPERFNITELAPQFADLEHASYTALDPRFEREVFRIVFPLLKPISVRKFLELAPSIQKWANGDGRHPESFPYSYDIGNFCTLPSYHKGDSGLRVECVSPGWIMCESMLDELKDTGFLTLT